MSDETMNAEITSDDKLLAALAYAFIPVITPLIILLLDDKKNRPFIRAHNAQALVFGILMWAISIPVVTSCVGVLLWFVAVYWGVKAYQGEYVEIPIISDFVRNQGWA